MTNSKLNFSKKTGLFQIMAALFILISQAAFAQSEDPIKLLDKEQPKKAITLLREATKTAPSAQSWYKPGIWLNQNQ